MVVYMVTDDTNYGCSLIGIFDTKERAEEGRRRYLIEHNRQKYLDKSLESHIKTITSNLERGFYYNDSLVKETLALSEEDRAAWWLDVNYKIRDIELNLVVSETLYEE